MNYCAKLTAHSPSTRRTNHGLERPLSPLSAILSLRHSKPPPLQFCPFKGCPSHHLSKNAVGWSDNGKTLSHHLRDLHKNQLHQLSDSLLDSLDLEICRRCDNAIYSEPHQLEQHIKAKHVSTRTLSNLDLATNLIFKATTNSEANQWEAGLTWLQQIYEPSPPSFRQSLLLNLKHKSLDAVVDTFRDLITATVEASKPPSSTKDKSNRHFKSDPFWLLTTIFEQLILAPRPPKHELPPGAESTTQCIYRRLRWFRAGRISELYEESRKVKSKPPSSLRSSSNDSSYREKNAQLAADQDNFGTCNARLTKDTPVAVVNDDNIGALYDLHPPEVYPPSVAPLRPRRRKTRKSRFSNKRRITFTADTIVKNILHLKKGKAPGIQVDSIDLLIYLAQRCKQPNAKHGLKPFASTLASFFPTAANGEIPEKLVNVFRTTYLVALEKDPSNKTKLRPLGIPTAIRRITANAIANELKSTFVTYLLPPYN